MSARANLRHVGLALTALWIMAFGPGRAEAGFLGLTVDAEYLFPNGSTVVQDLGNSVITPGFTFDFTVSGVLVDVNDGSIVTRYDQTAVGADFNGFRLTVVGPDPGITSVAIDPTTSIPGFDASRLSFTSNSIMENIQGLQGTSLSSIVLDVQFATVPEPSSVGLVLLGGILSAGAARHRARKPSRTRSGPLLVAPF